MIKSRLWLLPLDLRHYHIHSIVGSILQVGCKESDARSLRGGEGELGELKPQHMASLLLHKDKLEHTI
jgi:hypothetical protein